MEGRQLACSIQRVDDITIVTLETYNLGKSNVKNLKTAIAREVDFTRRVVVDFGCVEYFDCSGLSLIVHWLAEGHRAAGKVVLCSASPRLRALIEMVRIASFATVYSSPDEAIDACRETDPATGDATSDAAMSANSMISRRRQTAASNA